MMKRKGIAWVLGAALCLSQFACGGTPQNPPNEQQETYEQTVLDVSRAQRGTYFAEDYEAYPTPSGETKKQSYVVNLSFAEKDEVFAATTLQGIVNRENPELYVLSNAILTGYEGYNSTEFWLNALKENYSEYSFTQIANLTALVLRYRNSIRGAVVYPDRLATNRDLFFWEQSRYVYADSAVVNLTQMICAQEDAIPLTRSRLTALNAALTQAGAAPLAEIEDTSRFLIRNDTLVASDDREAWRNVYEYALGKAERGEWQFSQKALMHRSSFAIADNDYAVAFKLFPFGRIRDMHSTQAERDLERRWLALTPANTPVMGCYHATQSDELRDTSGRYIGYEEHITCLLYNSLGKYWYVSYGTFNLSYTSGLPKERGAEKSETLVYDPSKTYVAFSFTEGDNNSYVHYRLSQEYVKPQRGTFAMTWQISQGIYDLNPNVIRYLNVNNTEKDGLAFGSSGIGYVNGEVTNKADFYGLSDSYCKKSGISALEVFTDDLGVGLEYSAYTDSADLFIGFSGAYNVFQTDSGSMYRSENAVFRNVFHTKVDPEKLTAGGNLLSIRFHGWDDGLEDVAAFVSKLPEGVETVTQAQLADLLRQKERAEQASAIAFGADFYKSDETYLYREENTTLESGTRRVARDGLLVYRLSLGSQDAQAELRLSLEGSCKVRVSADAKNWLTLRDSYKIPASLRGKPFYLLLTPTAESFAVKGVTARTQEGGFSESFTVDCASDEGFRISGGEKTEGGRTGITDYRFPLAKGITEAVISVRSKCNVAISVSPNGKNFYPAEVLREGEVWYTVADGLSANTVVRVLASDSMSRIKVTPVRKVGAASFSPCGTPLDLGACVAGDGLTRREEGNEGYAETYGTESLLWVFESGEGLMAPFLTYRASGNWKLEISSDGKNFVELGSGQGDRTGTADASAWIGAGKRFWIRFSATSGSARLYRLKWVG